MPMATMGNHKSSCVAPQKKVTTKPSLSQTISNSSDCFIHFLLEVRLTSVAGDNNNKNDIQNQKKDKKERRERNIYHYILLISLFNLSKTDIFVQSIIISLFKKPPRVNSSNVTSPDVKVIIKSIFTETYKWRWCPELRIH